MAKDDIGKKKQYLKKYKKRIYAGDKKTPSYAQYLAAQEPVYLKGFSRESYESQMKGAGMTNEEINRFKSKKTLTRKKK